VKFVLDAEQKLFGETLDKLLSAADAPGAARAWAVGDSGPGLTLWRALADAGVFALAVPEPSGGVGVLPVELVTAFTVIGGHGVPGPYMETVAVAELLSRLAPSLRQAPLPRLAPSLRQAPLTRQEPADAWLASSDAWLPRIAEGTAVASLVLPPDVPYALDADVADVVLAVDGDGGLRLGARGTMHTSLDPARRLFSVSPAKAVSDEAVSDMAAPAAVAAFDMGALLCAAQLAGIGERLLSVTVEYAKTRQQFGRPIGSFQAVKHHLANAYVALEYARPLLYGAALAYGSADFPREVSAAKAATSDATYFASRIALQVHGAIGYTDEYDPSLLIRKARALRGAWGSPSTHRSRVLASLI